MLRWNCWGGGLAPAFVFLLLFAIPGIPARAEQDLVRRQHSEWTVQCRKTHQGQPLCMAFTTLKAPNGAAAGILGAQPVAGQRLLSLSLESGYSLGSRVELRVDGNPPSQHDGCENLHCHILLSAEDPLQVQLRRGNQLYVRGANMDYQASLIGYTAAQETWMEMQKARR
jgi:invasion protein IalB